MRAKSAVRVWAIIFALWPFVFSAPSVGQPSTGVSIKWEVKSRFRLFKNEVDFIYMVRFHGHDGVLAAETALAARTKGVGWASEIVTRLCVDINSGSKRTHRKTFRG
jgi:hypothetical protein